MTNDLQARILAEEARRRQEEEQRRQAQARQQQTQNNTRGLPPPGVDSTAWLQQQYREQITNPPPKAPPPAPAPIPAQPPAVTAPTGNTAYTQAIQQAQQVRQQPRPVTPIRTPLPDIRPVTPSGTNLYTQTTKKAEQQFIELNKPQNLTPARFRQIVATGQIMGTPQATTDPDKYTVRIAIPGTNQTISATISRDEVIKRGYIQVGRDNFTGTNPEYVLKSEFDKLKAESPGLADTLLRKGTVAVSADIKNINEREQANYEIAQAKYLKDLADYKADQAEFFETN